MEFEKIREIISLQLSIPLQDLKLETSLKEDLGADSLDIFQIICEIEECFDIEFPLDLPKELITLGDLAAYVNSLSA